MNLSDLFAGAAMLREEKPRIDPDIFAVDLLDRYKDYVPRVFKPGTLIAQRPEYARYRFPAPGYPAVVVRYLTHEERLTERRGGMSESPDILIGTIMSGTEREVYVIITAESAVFHEWTPPAAK